MPFVTRFAPSPTGRLHIGHAASALHVWKMAKERGGTVLLRIEDIDVTRCRPHLTEAIYEDLQWLGFDWPHPVRVQSNHFSDYQTVVESLSERGLAYKCFRTRAQVAKEIEDAKGTVFSGQALSTDEEHARIENGDAYAWRLSLAHARNLIGRDYETLTYRVETDSGLQTLPVHPDLHGDIIIARKDSPSAYHIAATCDDALQGITHIIRGEDLIDAPHIQVLLQNLMNWPAVIYHHHQLIMGPDGRKLSKSQGSITLADLRADGMTATQVRERLGYS